MINALLRIRVLALVLMSLWMGTSHAGTVTVAVASNFTAPMQALARAFTEATGHQAVLSFGATGKFYAQIRQGAPFDVLLSADATTPAKIAAEGLGDASSLRTYAIGRLVLWSPQPDRVDAQGHVLARTDWKHVAMANPRLAPYGSAAMQTLQHLGLSDSVRARIVQGENISQTYQFVASGNAELGFVALSQVMRDGRMAAGSAWVVPAQWHAPIRQDAIVLERGRRNDAAWALMRFLQTEQARQLLAGYGYSF